MAKLKKHNLRLEISLTLLIKAIAIYLIWLIFFSQPLDKTLTETHVSDFLLTPAPAEQNPVHKPIITPQEE